MYESLILYDYKSLFYDILSSLNKKKKSPMPHKGFINRSILISRRALPGIN